ncbi:MAG: MarR family transcriptional regulator [Halopseudomonas sp.]|uniref:MarR family winged helix-turn-helix transcriptional regulator n=1 Tax=Halopseudomonas sp. TaxID=2901191 RepID=UPI0030033643
MSSSQSHLLIELVTLHSKIQKRLAGPLSCHGISLTDYLVLQQLAHAPDKRLRRVDLAQQVGLSASGVTRLLSPLQKIGLISKEESARDARVSLVTLTAAGERIFRDALATFDQTAQALLGSVSHEDQKTLLRITGSLL